MPWMMDLLCIVHLGAPGLWRTPVGLMEHICGAGAGHTAVSRHPLV